MPNTKISALTAASALAGTEVLPVVQSSATVGATVDQIRDVVKAVDATSTDGFILETSTAATVGAQKYSPRVRWKGNGWKTTAAAASQSVEFIAEVQPVQGSTNPTGNWVLRYSVNGAAYATAISVDTDGIVTGTVAFYSSIFGSSQGFRVDNTGIQHGSDKVIGWRSGTTSGAIDAAFYRNAAGVVEVNNGTAGTFRDIKVRNLLASGGNGSYVQTPSMTVANLASAATAGKGALAYVTDATATTPRSTVAGGGANEVLVMSNATNWLIVA